MPTQALVTSRMIQVMRAVSALRVSEQHCRVQHLSSALLTVHAPITIIPKMVVRTHVLVTSLADTISRVATVVLSRVATVVLSRVATVVLSRDSVSIPQATIQMLSIA